MGAQNGTLTLAIDGATLSGKMVGAAGETELQDGAVDGETLTWKADITAPMAMTLEFTASVSGDDITGTVKLGAFGDAAFTGTRA